MRILTHIRPSTGVSRAVLLGAVLLAGLIPVSPARAAFGLSGFDVTFTNSDGSVDTRAGSHPFAATGTIALNTTLGEPNTLEGELKDISIAQIVGLVGAPKAMPRCSTQQFLDRPGGNGDEAIETSCPDSTAVGVTTVALETADAYSGGAVYNLEPPPGVAVKLGFFVASIPITLEVGVNPNPPYNVIVKATSTPQVEKVFGTKLTIWGVPGDPAHDPFRGKCDSIVGNAQGEPISRGICPAGSTEEPFLTLPRACEGPLASTYALDSWEEPGSYLPDGEPDLSDPAWKTGSVLTHDGLQPSNPVGMTGCAKLGFSPTVAAIPTTATAASPTGLNFDLDVHDEGLTTPDGIAQSDIEKAAVVLPEAVTVNPALAEGLSACSESDLSRETIGTQPGEGCPEGSKIGTVEVETPLLDKTLKGSLFLASPYANQFGSLLALYVVVKDPETGILIKIPGKVEPNPTTGQLVSLFDNLPQLPFSHFRLSFRQGQRSPLVTPSTCGTYTTQAELTPWANPNTVLRDTSTFQVTTGINGGPCPSGGVPPFKPGLVAGTENNAAGAYSPLDIRITRNDGEQEITGLSTQLPPGLTANLSGVPFCSEGDIALAKGKSGAREESEPSCPVASRIGHTLVGVGVGAVLAYTPGRLYMAGPFEGAPFSVVAITSAKVGPFDLGTVVVHLPLLIDPNTATVSIPAGAADQIPHIVKGIVVHVRDIRVYVDRASFTRNPTNCSPLLFGAGVIGSGQNFASPADDVTSGLSNPFEVANCANLAFKPDFKVSTSGKTSKADGASLSVKLAFPNTSVGTQANIHSVKVELPKQLPSRLTTLQKACTAAQFHANPAGCPAASVVGHARAITPILPVPLEGPAYFVSNGGEAFPNLIMVLQGYGVTIDLVGSTFISKTGVTSSTFKTVPDQPVSSFELTLPQGPFSALTANGNLCSLTKIVTVKKKVTVRVKGRKRMVMRSVKQTKPASLTMPTEFIAQNGAVVHQVTAMSVTGCPKAKPAKKKTKPAKKATAKKKG